MKNKQDQQLPCGVMDGPFLLPNGPGVTVNRYPGRCSICGHLVPAGTGRVKKMAGMWSVFH